MGVEWFPEKGKLRIFTMEEELDFGGAFEGGVRHPGEDLIITTLRKTILPKTFGQMKMVNIPVIQKIIRFFRFPDLVTQICISVSGGVSGSSFAI